MILIVREKSIKIWAGQGKSWKVREFFSRKQKGQGKSGENFNIFCDKF